MYVCTFHITEYGFSGNDLPPPMAASFSHSVLSGGADTEETFRARMQEEGMAIRGLLASKFDAAPKPYSQADTCGWSISKIGTVTEIVKLIYSQ